MNTTRTAAFEPLSRTARWCVGLSAWICASAASAQVGAGGPPTPFVDSGACPFEGCQYTKWTANAALEVHRLRSRTSPVVFRLKLGDTITAVTGVLVTEIPAQVRFRDSVWLGTASGRIHITPADTLYLLTYEGEGFTTAWFKGRLYRGVDGSGIDALNGVCGFRTERCPGRVVVPQRRVWWIYVRRSDGEGGWTDEPARFDGKDALGKP